MRHDFLSGNSISEPLTVSNDQMEKTVIAEKLIDFSFLINPKWKKTCSSLSRQCMWERRREERERGERIIIKITQINLGECSCHFSALSIRGKCRFTPASFVSNVSSNEDHQTTVLSHPKGGFSGHYSTCILPDTSVGQNASHFLFVRPECASYSAKWKKPCCLGKWVMAEPLPTHGWASWVIPDEMGGMNPHGSSMNVGWADSY